MTSFFDQSFLGRSFEEVASTALSALDPHRRSSALSCLRSLCREEHLEQMVLKLCRSGDQMYTPTVLCKAIRFIILRPGIQQREEEVPSSGDNQNNNDSSNNSAAAAGGGGGGGGGFKKSIFFEKRRFFRWMLEKLLAAAVEDPSWLHEQRREQSRVEGTIQPQQQQYDGGSATTQSFASPFKASAATPSSSSFPSALKLHSIGPFSGLLALVIFAVFSGIVEESAAAESNINDGSDLQGLAEGHLAPFLDRVSPVLRFSVLQQMIQEFADQKRASMHDTFNNRAFFMGFFFQRCVEAVDNDINFFRMESSADFNVKQLFMSFLFHVERLLREVDEYMNFLLNHSMHLFVFSEESIPVPIDWCYSLSLVVKKSLHFFIAISQSSKALRDRFTPGSEGFRIVEGFLSVATTLSTIPPESFTLPRSAFIRNQLLNSAPRHKHMNNNNNTFFSGETKNNEDPRCQQNGGDNFGGPGWNVKTHVTSMLEICHAILLYASCRVSSWDRGNKFLLYDSCARILASTAERFPNETVDALHNPSIDVPSPEELQSLALFCCRASGGGGRVRGGDMGDDGGEDQEGPSANTLRAFLVFANVVLQTLPPAGPKARGSLQRAHNSCREDSLDSLASVEFLPADEDENRNPSSSNNNTNSTSNMTNDFHNMTDRIRSVLQPLVINSVNALFHSCAATYLSNARHCTNTPIGDESDALLSGVSALLLRRSGDCEFLALHLSHLFRESRTLFFDTPPHEWTVPAGHVVLSPAGQQQQCNNNNQQGGIVAINAVVALPLVLVTVGQALLGAGDSPFVLCVNEIQKMLEEMSNYASGFRLCNDLDDDSPSRSHASSLGAIRSHFHPLVLLLARIFDFSNELAEGSVDALQNLLENFSVSASTNRNNDGDDDYDNDDEDDPASQLIFSEHENVFRALFFLFRCAVRAQLYEGFASAGLKLASFIIRSAGENTTLDVVTDAVDLISSFWGSGHEWLAQTAQLGAAEQLCRAFCCCYGSSNDNNNDNEDNNNNNNNNNDLICAAADSKIYYCSRRMVTNSRCNNRFNEHDMDARFEIRQRALACLFQRANVFCGVGDHIEGVGLCDALLRQIHRIFRQNIARAEANNSSTVQAAVALRVYLRDMKAAFMPGAAEVLHQFAFKAALTFVVGVPSVVTCDFPWQYVADDDGAAACWNNNNYVDNGDDDDNSFSLRRVCAMIIDIEHRGRTDSAREGYNHYQIMRALVADLLELLLIVTNTAKITLGRTRASRQLPLYFMFSADCLHLLASLMREGGTFFYVMWCDVKIVVLVAKVVWNLLEATWVDMGALLQLSGECARDFWAILDEFSNFAVAAPDDGGKANDDDNSQRGREQEQRRRLQGENERHAIMQEFRYRLSADDAAPVAKVGIISSSVSTLEDLCGILRLFIMPSSAFDELVTLDTSDPSEQRGNNTRNTQRQDSLLSVSKHHLGGSIRFVSKSCPWPDNVLRWCGLFCDRLADAPSLEENFFLLRCLQCAFCSSAEILRRSPLDSGVGAGAGAGAGAGGLPQQPADCGDDNDWDRQRWRLQEMDSAVNERVRVCINTVLPLAITEKLSHSLENATSAMAILARLYQRNARFFSSVVGGVKERCSLTLHRERVDFVMGCIVDAPSYLSAVRRLVEAMCGEHLGSRAVASQVLLKRSEFDGGQLSPF